LVSTPWLTQTGKDTFISMAFVSLGYLWGRGIDAIRNGTVHPSAVMVFYFGRQNPWVNNFIRLLCGHKKAIF